MVGVIVEGEVATGGLVEVVTEAGDDVGDDDAGGDVVVVSRSVSTATRTAEGELSSLSLTTLIRTVAAIAASRRRGTISMNFLTGCVFLRGRAADGDNRRPRTWRACGDQSLDFRNSAASDVSVTLREKPRFAWAMKSI